MALHIGLCFHCSASSALYFFNIYPAIARRIRTFGRTTRFFAAVLFLRRRLDDDLPVAPHSDCLHGR